MDCASGIKRNAAVSNAAASAAAHTNVFKIAAAAVHLRCQSVESLSGRAPVMRARRPTNRVAVDALTR